MRANQEYLEALRAARAAGVTWVELGQLLGMSKQAVHEYVNRYGKEGT
jgi:hypothetical protein